MAKIIVITNQKGGVAKTTTACALIDGLANRGKRVLGIDLDPQGSLGFSLGIDIDNSFTVYEVLKKQIPIEDAILVARSGHVLPANILLSSADLEFNRPGREYLLKDVIQPIENKYDYIIIDTPPALNILTINAYVVANSLIIPMIPEILSLLGISQLKETIDTVNKFYNPSLTILGILLTRYNNRVKLTEEVYQMANQIAIQLNTAVFDVQIRNNIAAAEAPAHGQGILTYAPKSNAAMDYNALIDKIV